jgi:nucleoside-diphosphate-sugar epimerase
MKTVLIAGCGFVGRIAAQKLHEAGWNVTGLTSSPASAQILSSMPFRVIACDITRREQIVALNLQNLDAVIDCVSAGGGGAEEYRQIYFEGAGNLLEVLQPRQFLFTGSSSVYAQDDGSWVTEASPANPETDTGLVLRSTEKLVLSHGGTVARLTGIYGPGRAMLLRRYLEGSALLEGDGSRYLNQIHRADAASAICLLLQTGATGLFNVTDNASPSQREFYGWLAAHFDRPLPASGASDPQRRRFATNKRVSNAKIRALGWQPQYPSFKDALMHDAELLKT